MSNEPGFYVQKATDKKLINTVLSLVEKYPKNIFQVHFNVSGLGGFNIASGDLKKSIEENENIQELGKNSTHLISNIIIYSPNLLIDIKRGELIPHPSPLLDYVAITDHNHKAPNHEAIEPLNKIHIAKYLQNELLHIPTPELLSANLPQEYGALISLHNSMLSKLEEINADILVQTQQRTQDLEIGYWQKRQDLEDSFNNRSEKLLQELHDKQKALEKSHEEKLSLLDQQKQELDERSSRLDDRDNTHVRREIRDRMLNDVKARINDFGVSKATNRKRLPVSIGLMTMALLFLLLLIINIININHLNAIAGNNYTTSNNIDNNEQTATTSNSLNGQQKSHNSDSATLKEIFIDSETSLIFAWIKLSIISIGLIGTILYYIKWQSRWADYHANSEFQLQQFYIDINRANWVIESCLEWRKETDSVIPAELLASITRNLFAGENRELEQVMHPADELASALLGKASQLKMNIAGNELLIEKPGKIKPITTQSK